MVLQCLFVPLDLFDTGLKVLLMRSDGLDQAKHRVPRELIQSKTFSELIRPACHVMMNWCHGYSFHFAVSDADCYKAPCLLHFDHLSF